MNRNDQYIYVMSENQIVKISELFGCLEDAIKELIRSRRTDGVPSADDTAQMNLFEATSRTLYECGEEDLDNTEMDRDKYF